MQATSDWPNQRLQANPLSEHEGHMRDLAKRIKTAREAAGINQSELARRLGIKSQSVNMWEQGKSIPNRDNLLKVARETSAPLTWLIYGGPLPERDANGRFVPEAERGQFIPMVSVNEAIQHIPSAESAPRFFVHFPCGNNSFFVTLENDSCAPEHPFGTRWAIDPDLRPQPGDKVLASANDEPVFGEYVTEATARGMVEIVKPLNARWAPARSDLVTLDIIGTMTEYVRRR